jgi:hypothetical protein
MSEQAFTDEWHFESSSSGENAFRITNSQKIIAKITFHSVAVVSKLREVVNQRCCETCARIRDSHFFSLFTKQYVEDSIMEDTILPLSDPNKEEVDVKPNIVPERKNHDSKGMFQFHAHLFILREKNQRTNLPRRSRF